MKVDYYHLKSSLLTLKNELPFMEDWVYHLINHRGLPGFVQTFKSLKQWALQIISGNRIFKVEWFKSCTYKGYRIPTKYQKLFRLLVDTVLKCDESPKLVKSQQRKLRLILSSINIYQVVEGPNHTDMIKQTCVAFLEPAAIEMSKDQYYKDLLRLACYAILIRPDCSLGKLRPTGQSVAISPGVNSSWKKFVANKVFTALADWQSEGWVNLLTPERLSLMPCDFQGNLTFIGEAGGKTRMILVGEPFIQAKLRNLKNSLLNILSNIPTDCTFNQNEGVDFIRRSYSKGYNLYSIDLSDATWNFPSSLQDYVLRKIGVTRKVRDFIFRTPVYSTLTKERRLVKKGQAMGLGPSFPLFTLTHNLILAALCNLIGIDPVESFRVLGDDVFMTNLRLRELYLKFLKDYEVPISLGKTLTSRSTGEFAGRLIYHGCDITPIRWRKLSWNSIPNLYWDYRSVIGKKNLHLLFGSKARVSLAVMGPLSRKVGGLGLHFPQPDISESIAKLRSGIIESWLEGDTETTSSGVHKIPNQNVEIQSVFRTLFTPQVLRTLDTLLVDDSIYDTKYGQLPALSPKPANVLTQLGYKRNLIPERSVFSLVECFRARFKRSKRSDWRAFQQEALASGKEGLNEKSSKNTTVATETQETVYRTFFSFNG